MPVTTHIATAENGKNQHKYLLWKLIRMSDGSTDAVRRSVTGEAWPTFDCNVIDCYNRCGIRIGNISCSGLRLYWCPTGSGDRALIGPCPMYPPPPPSPSLSSLTLPTSVYKLAEQAVYSVIGGRQCLVWLRSVPGLCTHSDTRPVHSRCVCVCVYVCHHSLEGGLCDVSQTSPLAAVPACLPPPSHPHAEWMSLHHTRH